MRSISKRRVRFVAPPTVFALATLLGVRAPAFADSGEPIEAQPTLATAPLRIIERNGTSHTFTVELAKTPREQQVGLMFRHVVAPDGGMLFTWAEPQVSQMWMENTLVPLDMVFIAGDGRIDSISENTVPHSLAIVSSDGPVTATLELAAGTTGRLGITVGDRVVSTALPRF